MYVFPTYDFFSCHPKNHNFSFNPTLLRSELKTSKASAHLSLNKFKAVKFFFANSIHFVRYPDIRSRSCFSILPVPPPDQVISKDEEEEEEEEEEEDIKLDKGRVVVVVVVRRRRRLLIVHLNW